MLNRTIMFSSLSLILSSLPHSAYSMDEFTINEDIPIQGSIPQKKQEESIDKYPNSTGNVVKYTTRAMGNLLNQCFDLLGDQDEEFLNFRNNASSIIDQTLESPFVFFIAGSAHDYFLKMQNISLGKDGTTQLKGTNSTFMDLAKALVNMDISLENKKESNLRDDKVYITIKKLKL